ncbi:hypothetical protein AM233_12285 [Bacillus sp. FJAT-22058]|nr:hypothetical protein AM233_12285 [Bacillus sp. FJAT-22058]
MRFFHNHILSLSELIKHRRNSFIMEEWRNGEITAVMFMEMLERKNNTFYRKMKEYEEEK